MGNKISRRGPVVDERYTRTQGLYQHRDVDPRKLRRLILNGQLAPCFPGAEDNAAELDECPICFLYYPSLNRSKCCTKGICTECFLQIKSPHSARPTQCPFCKTSSYVVEYRGAKTVEEKGVEQAEEQKVIEAKIRIRQKELLDEEERMLRREEDQGQDYVPDRFRQNFSNLHGFTLPSNATEEQEVVSTGEQDVGVLDDTNTMSQQVQACQAEDVSEQLGTPQTRVEPASEGVVLLPCIAGQLRDSSFQRLNRADDFDVDLEEIMVMEAIWLSIQDQGQSQQDQLQSLTASDHARTAINETGTADTMTPVQESSETRTLTGRGTATGGLAGAIAALAERQATSAGSSNANPSSGRSNRNAGNREENIANVISNDEQLGGPLIINNIPRGMVPNVSVPDVEVEQGQTEKCLTDEIAPQEENDGGEELNNWIEVSMDSGMTISPLVRGGSRSSMSEWLQDQSSEAVEVGTSFSSSIPSASDLPWDGSDFVTPQSTENIEEPPGSTQQPIAMLPDTFEEQMMLAMALSLAEAQAQAWQQ